MKKKKAISLKFLPSRLKKTLMKFQRDGIRYGIEKKGRCMIGDEMGLGKTLQAIGIAYYFKATWPLLIIVPSSMRFSWVNELEEWIPDLKPGDINIVRSLSCISSMMNSRVNIIGYGLFSMQKSTSSSIAQVIRNANMGVVIMDESHYIRNMKAARTKEVLKSVVKIPHMILLSGTPSLSRPIELYAQISVLRSGLFGSFQEYARKYCAAHYTTEKMKDGRLYQKFDTRGASNLEELHHNLVKHVMIRRLKKQVLTQLPAKRRQKIMFEISNSSCYKKEVNTHYKELKDILGKLSNEQHDSDQLVTSHDCHSSFTRLFSATALAKAGPVQQYIMDLLEGMENKFLVFCFHMTMVQAVRQTLISKNIKHICITGKVNSMQRGLDAEIFQTDPTCRVAVLSIQAASTGLTLTAADHIIFAELHFTPGVLIQAEDRCHRIGQMNAVQVHYLIAIDTIDELLWTSLQRKVIVTTATLNGKISNLPVDKENFEKNSILSAVEAWVPFSVLAETDVVNNLFEKKSDHDDIRSFFTPEGRKKRRRKRNKKNTTADVVMLFSDNDEDFQPMKKKKKDTKLASHITESGELDTLTEVERPLVKTKIPVPCSNINIINESSIASGNTYMMVTPSESDILKYSQITEVKMKERNEITEVERTSCSEVTETRNSEDVYFPHTKTLKFSKMEITKSTKKNSHTGVASELPVYIDIDDSEEDEEKGSSFDLSRRKATPNAPHSPLKHSDLTPSNAQQLPLIERLVPSPPPVESFLPSDEDLFANDDEDDQEEQAGSVINSLVIANSVVNCLEEKNLPCNSSKTSGWYCSECTFLNHDLLNNCEICNSVKNYDVVESKNENPIDNICSSSNSYPASAIEVFSSDDDEDWISSHTSDDCNSWKRRDMNISVESIESDFVFDDDNEDELDRILSGLSEDDLSSQNILSNENNHKIGVNENVLFEFPNDSIDQDILSMKENTQKAGEDRQKDDEDLYESEEDDEEVEEREIKKIEFRYCMSFYTKRVFLYDKAGEYLQLSFNVQNMSMKMFEDLPPLLQHPENLKQLKVFSNQWKQLGPLQQSLVRKNGSIFLNPVEMYTETFERKHVRVL